MIRATMSLRGLYRYDNTIFDELVLPETDVDRDDLIEALVLECADLELLYPQPEVMRDAIGLWSRRRLSIWIKLAETLHYEYNPIHNYDRLETHERSTDQLYSNRRDSEIESSESGTSTGESTGESSSTATGSRNAYNSGWTEQDRTVNAGTGSTETSETTSRSGTQTGSTSDTGEQAETENISIRAAGNIGVTTTQQMIEDQRRVVAYNLTEVIIDEFRSRFCLLIY